MAGLPQTRQYAAMCQLEARLQPFSLEGGKGERANETASRTRSTRLPQGLAASAVAEPPSIGLGVALTELRRFPAK